MAIHADDIMLWLIARSHQGLPAGIALQHGLNRTARTSSGIGRQDGHDGLFSRRRVPLPRPGLWPNGQRIRRLQVVGTSVFILMTASAAVLLSNTRFFIVTVF